MLGDTVALFAHPSPLLIPKCHLLSMLGFIIPISSLSLPGLVCARSGVDSILLFEWPIQKLKNCKTILPL